MVESDSAAVAVPEEYQGLMQFLNVSLAQGEKVSIGQEVLITYQLSKHQDPDTVIASASSEKPYKFILGANQVIKGFEAAVSQLSVGSKAAVLIHSDLAYGKVGQPPDILDDENLII